MSLGLIKDGGFIDPAKAKQTELLCFVIGSLPDHYARQQSFTPDHSTLTIHANTQVNIGGKGCFTSEDTVLDLSDLGTAEELAGKDVFIYACQPADEKSAAPDFILSLDDAPDGYSAADSRKIGGFSCYAEDDGDYFAGDIIPSSVWDLKSASFAAKGTFTIAAADWTTESDNSLAYPAYADIAVIGLKTSDIADVIFDNASETALASCGVCNIKEIAESDGKAVIRIKAESAPSAAVSGEYHVFKGAE